MTTSSTLRLQIREILSNHFNNLDEVVYNSKLQYAIGTNKFPEFDGIKSPDDLSCLDNYDFDLNQDNSDEDPGYIAPNPINVRG